jgi:hypothetical protein
LLTRFFPYVFHLVGVQERTMIYSEMLWMALQALLLIRG